MHFGDYFFKNAQKSNKLTIFDHFPINWEITSFFNFTAFFAKLIPKMHEITSYFYDKRNLLTQNIWSHGTPLGYLGPGSLKRYAKKISRA